MKKKSPTPSLIDNEIAVKPNSLEGGAVHLDGASLNSTQSLVKRNATGKKGNQKKKFIEEDAQSKSLDEIALASKAMFAMNEGGGVASDVNQGPDLLLAMNESTPSSSTEKESDTCKSENASGDKEQDGCAALLPAGGVTEGGIAAGALAAGEGGISAGAIAAGVLLLAGGVAAGVSGGGGGGGSSGGGSTGGSGSAGSGSTGGGGAVDTLGPGYSAGSTTLSVVVPDAADGIINKAEADDGVGVNVRLPSDAVAGDKITVSIDGGTAVEHIVSAADITAGTVTVTLPPGAIAIAGQGAGVITTAYTDANNNPAKDSPVSTPVTIDTMGPGYSAGSTTLSVVVPDAADGIINKAEADDGVGVNVRLPSDAVAGDKITVSIDGGTAVEHIVSAADITAGTVTVTLPPGAIAIAGQGAGVITTAYTDANNNPAKDSPVSTPVTIDTMGPGYSAGSTTLSVVVPDAADGIINKAEADDGVGVNVRLPSDAVAGDKITVSIDGGTAVEHIVSAADITAGTVTVTLPPGAIAIAGQGAGVITTAYTDANNNPAKDSPVSTPVTIDTMGPGYSAGSTTLSVVVPDAADGIINKAEADDGVGVNVRLPSDAVAGDKITVSIDGGTAVEHIVSAADITAGTVTVTLPPGAIAIAGQGAGVITTAYTDANNNPAKDSPVSTPVTIDTMGPGYSAGSTTLSVVVPDAADGIINKAEADDGVGVNVRLPSDAVAGDKITVSIDGGTAVEHIVSAADITAGTVTVTLPPGAIAIAGQGAGVITTAYTDANNNPAKDSPVSTPVTIDTMGPGYSAGSTTLSVVVPDAADGIINKAEADDGVGVNVRLPSDAVAGDKITVSIDGGTAVEHIVSAADITAGTVTVTLPPGAIAIAGQGAGVITTAYTDANNNPAKDSPVSTPVTIDTMGPGYSAGSTTLSVVVPDAADGIINKAEADDGVGVNVRLPSDAVAGDKITVSIDGGTAVEHIVSAADITAGTVTVTLPPGAIAIAGQGAGVITTAYTDANNNPAKDSPVSTPVTIDTMGPGYSAGSTTLSVVVPDAADGIINKAEADDGVGVNVRLPSDAVAGDKITVSIDGGTAVEHIVSAADITAGTVTVTLPPGAIAIAGQGAGVITTAYTDANNNPAKDSPVSTPVTIDTMGPGYSAGSTTLSVVVPDAADGIINKAEADDGVGVNVRLPSDAVAGDKITVSIDGGTAVEHIVTAAEAATAASLGGSTITVTLPAAAITAAGEGAGVITTAYTDANNNPAKDSPVSTPVTIDTMGPGYSADSTTLSVVVPDAADGIINKAEADDGVGVNVRLPSDAVAGDKITVSIDGGTAVEHIVTAAEAATAASLGGSTITVTLPAAAITAAGEGAGVITTAYTDANNNPAKDSPVSTNVTIDTLAPTATVGDNTSGTTPGPFTFSFIFDEAVSGFNINNVNVTGGTKGEFTAVNDFEYRLVVNPDSGINNGTITLTENMAGVTDAAGNVAATPSPYTQTYDTLAPTVTITDNTAGTASGPVTFTFTFNEAVSGFDENDVTVSAGTKGAFTAVSPTEYTLVVTPPSSTGTMEVGVTAGSFSDLAGNLNTVAPTPDSQPYTSSSEIVLGAGYGKLILPVDVDGSRFYLWSRNGDSTFNAGDIVTHDYLNTIFNHDINGTVNPAGNTTDTTYRYGNINGVHLALPVAGAPAGTALVNTAVNTSPPNQNNPTYDGLAAIWDAYSNATNSAGIPPGWSASGVGSVFWAADGTTGSHSSMNLHLGYVNVYADNNNQFAILQVVL